MRLTSTARSERCRRARICRATCCSCPAGRSRRSGCRLDPRPHRPSTRMRHRSRRGVWPMTHLSDAFTLKPIGYIRSALEDLTQAPRQGIEGAPDAWIDLDPQYIEGLKGLASGDEVIVLAWFHLADRGK